MSQWKALIVSDTHSGAKNGLGPKSDHWNWWRHTLKRIGRVDRTYFLGDAIDGGQHKSGGRGLMSCDPLDQCKTACEALSQVDCDDWRFVAGTGYHTGEVTDFERVVAGEFKSDLHDNLVEEIPHSNVIDARHYIGSSAPNSLMNVYTRTLARVHQGAQPMPDLILRGHVHRYVDLRFSSVRVITAPCLQTYGGIYGARVCDGVVDVGVLLMQVDREFLRVEPILRTP